ncbi:hypothetical protein HHI36_015088 [Cryptolaemus montrouzieri]|uniref:Uncharacterized protein n=1 Tax=Cryptolaemus montrouzieri TaxID=559131 RepID=A0ABD2N4K3_9CUCU
MAQSYRSRSKNLNYGAAIFLGRVYEKNDFCLYHQNVELMLHGANLTTVDHKDLLAVIVCNIDKYNCMVTGKYQDCPGQQALRLIFEESKEA